MDENETVTQLTRHIRDYAKGLETPRLAALLVQKYGRGVVDTIARIGDNPTSADAIARIVDDETTNIDPEWREHERERIASHPADVVANNETRNTQPEP